MHANANASSSGPQGSVFGVSTPNTVALCVRACRALHDLGRDGDFEAYGYHGSCDDTPSHSLNPSQQNTLSGVLCQCVLESTNLLFVVMQMQPAILSSMHPAVLSALASHTS